MKKTYNKFNDDKEILINGVLLEEYPIERTALHYDNRILVMLAYALVCQAVQDWKDLNRGTKEAFIESYGERVYRGEMQQFFKGSLFANIINVIAPNIDYEDAFKHMDGYELRPRQLGYLRGVKGESKPETRGGNHKKRHGNVRVE